MITNDGSSGKFYDFEWYEYDFEWYEYDELNDCFYADDGGVNYQKWFFWGDLREAPQHSLHRACVVHLLLIIYKNVEKGLNTPFFFLVLSPSLKSW